MNLKQRVALFVELGERLHNFIHYSHNTDPINSIFEQAIQMAFFENGWFNRANCLKSIEGISYWLSLPILTDFVRRYPFENADNQKNVLIIMAGNIPFVGFHDLMCVLLSGNKALLKLSQNDQVLMKAMVNVLGILNPEILNSIEIIDFKPQQVDAVIATGSNNSARYFEYYFGKYPHIIRHNRNSIAILTGNETKEELVLLGKDVFQYFGMGCRNVSKLYLPSGFELNRIFEAFIDYADVANNKKYFNNYEYHRAIYLLNQEKFLENGFFILKENELLYSPISVLHYEFYTNKDEVLDELFKYKDAIQCVVGGTTKFGETQSPKIDDFADGIDTCKFLAEL